MIVVGDCREVMAGMEPESVDAVVCDPPYELSFMGKGWDGTGIANDVGMWREALRVLKPGGHLVAFGGTRTSHRMVCAIEDAGFEIRDSLMWMYGSGFPKSHNLHGEHEGWGTALKPAHEPICLARKPLIGTIAANVAEHGTGAINVDACRIEGAPPSVPQPDFSSVNGRETHLDANRRNGEMSHAAGRWPSNVVLDEAAARALDEAVGERKVGKLSRKKPAVGWNGAKPWVDCDYGGDTGGPSRFFLNVAPIDSEDWDGARFLYQSKSSRAERNAGLDGMPERDARHYGVIEGHADVRPGRVVQDRKPTTASNHHPTVKPVALMRWLVRLVTPPGGLVLDMFAGSGSTGVACVAEGMRFRGIEQSPEYAAIAEARIAHAEAVRDTSAPKPADISDLPIFATAAD